ncbi:MAG: ABC transporter ATP-binding protein [candidate division Zixibacteria bacterium]|nr:ABC transporter ATP-binding protein [candidate division Zixibacteria bacterium]
MDKKAIIEIENLSFSYDGTNVLENVNLTIGEKDFVWIVGPNGGGKTTLLKLILGLLSPTKGSVRVFGTSPQQARTQIGYMPQYAQLDPSFPVSVLDVVLMGRLCKGQFFGPFKRGDRKIALEMLREVGLAEFADRHYASLSGGQQRRLLIARALASRPELLILDEPTANLDLLVVRELYELLHRLNKQFTIVMVSHDPAFVAQTVKNVICVNRRVAVHPTTEVGDEIMSELYHGQVRMVRHGHSAGEEK